MRSLGQEQDLELPTDVPGQASAAAYVSPIGLQPVPKHGLTPTAKPMPTQPSQATSCWIG